MWIKHVIFVSKIPHKLIVSWKNGFTVYEGPPSGFFRKKSAKLAVNSDIYQRFEFTADLEESGQFLL
jgi:hypothetical protein